MTTAARVIRGTRNECVGHQVPDGSIHPGHPATCTHQPCRAWAEEVTITPADAIRIAKEETAVIPIITDQDGATLIGVRRGARVVDARKFHAALTQAEQAQVAEAMETQAAEAHATADPSWLFALLLVAAVAVGFALGCLL